MTYNQVEGRRQDFVCLWFAGVKFRCGLCLLSEECPSSCSQLQVANRSAPLCDASTGPLL